MHRKDADGLFEGWLAGAVDRRTFVTRLLGLGVSVTSVAALLEACGGGSAPPERRPEPGEGREARPPEDELAGEPEKELVIANWSDYIAEDTVPNFEKETGIKVTYTTYESNEELMSKLQVGAGGFDLVVPTGYIVTVLAAQGLLAPLRKQALKNWGNLAPLFLNPSYDPDNAHSLPYLWGTTGIAYRTDKIQQPVDSWAVFHDAKLKNKMTMMDDQRDVIGAFLKLKGRSLNATDRAELDEAKADAIRAKALLKAYVSAPVKGQLVAGDVWLAQLWNGDTMQARAEQPAIGYALPKEGAGIWTDSLVIPKSAPHKRAAHRFLDYVLRPEVATAIANFTGYGTPNTKATPDSPVPFPTADELARLEYQKDLGAATALWDEIWTEIKSG